MRTAPFTSVDRLEAGERVAAVDVHRAGAADALAAGAAEGQRRIDLVLDLDQRVQDHRPAGVEIDLVGVGARVLPVVRVPAIDAELAHAFRTGGRLVGLAMADAAVGGKIEGDHLSVFLTSNPVAWPQALSHDAIGPWVPAFAGMTVWRRWRV